MKKIGILFAFAVLAFAVGCSSRRDQITEEVVSNDEVYDTVYESPPVGTVDRFISTGSIIETLTQTEWRGRMVGSPGNEAATAFLDDMFETIGLIPLVGGSFRMGYAQKAFDPDVANPQIDLIFNDGGRRSLVFGKEFSVPLDLPATELFLPATQNHLQDNIESWFYIGEVSYLQPQALRPVAEPQGIDFGIYSVGVFPTHATLEHNVRIRRQLYEETQWQNVAYIHFSVSESARETTAYNIVGVVPGVDRTRAVVVSANFDGVGYAGEFYSPGALDNASGVAAMLRAAQIILDQDQLPETDVVFAAVNGAHVVEAGLQALIYELLGSGLYDEIYFIDIYRVGQTGAPFNLEIHSTGADIDLNTAVAIVMHDIGIGFESTHPFIMPSFTSLVGIPSVSLTQFSTLWGSSYAINTEIDAMYRLDFDEINMTGTIAVEVIRRIGADFSFQVERPAGIGFVAEWQRQQRRLQDMLTADSDFNEQIVEITEIVNPFAALDTAWQMKDEAGIVLGLDELITFRVGDTMFTFGATVDGYFTYDEHRSLRPDAYIKQEMAGFELEAISISPHRHGGWWGGVATMFLPEDTSDAFATRILGAPIGEVHRIDLYGERNEVSLRYKRYSDTDYFSVWTEGQRVDIFRTEYMLIYVEAVNPHASVRLVQGWGTNLDEDLVGSPNYVVFGFDGGYEVFEYQGDLLTIRVRFSAHAVNMAWAGMPLNEIVDLIVELDIHNDVDYWLGLLNR